MRRQATKRNGQVRISKHIAFNHVSGTLAAGTMRKLMITLQHSPLHEIQAIESRSMHAREFRDSSVQVRVWCASNVTEVALAVHSLESL